MSPKDLCIKELILRVAIMGGVAPFPEELVIEGLPSKGVKVVVARPFGIPPKRVVI